MTHFNTGEVIVITASFSLLALCILLALFIAGAFTKATPYHFGQLALIAGQDRSARDKIRKLRTQKKVTLQDVRICASEIEELLDRKAGARALGRLGR